MSGTPCEQTDGELRCACGSLMARRTPAGLELKCRRCKRVVLVPLLEEDEAWVEVPVR